ncbi:hypothetical protein SAMN02745216_01270 [Desulfatibacillum alkenivorans DSM 16219]|jgi:hypothetical protein|uniref:DUF4129 domain-containing protein n=1 Tax=Desulfatibacillum alkenivorans DSM 16219 TaxID=1121393 RepID=A0A1M6HMY8_9BACT|nr:hypothetical protein [Desulfatibacillum alkenivorans]SHJ23611.1 hypothetical protein SAMN02745216_01270 [Desulfatibacillum alkenivorans DSM 16219]
MMRGRKKTADEKPALDLVEESVQLLRQGGLSLALPYLIGTVPFIIALLFFISDMGASPFAKQHLVPYSFALTVLFLWMKTCHLIFVQSILAGLYDQEPPGLKKILRALPSQAFIHAMGFIALPIAAMIALPIGWTIAFFQNALCIDFNKPIGLKSAWRQAWTQAMLWPGQNHAALFVLSVFSFTIWLNLFFFLIFLPSMAKILIGVESQYILCVYSTVFNAAYMSAVLGLTYICFDPFIKAMYALRCYYGASLSTGDDIKARLRRLKHAKTALAVAALCALCLFSGGRAMAEEAGAPRQTIDQPQLEKSIHDVMEQPVFSWRLPKELAPEPEQEQGFLAKAAKWVLEKLKIAMESIVDGVRAFWKWIENLLPKMDPKPRERKQYDSNIDWLNALKIVLWVLLIIALVGLILWFVKTLRQKNRALESHAEEAEPLPELDIMDEEITADRLSTNAWLDMARDLMAQGAHLEALRAYYLAALAQLAQADMISIAKYKSNREYNTELHRKARDKKELLELFGGAVKIFEKHWYGLYPVDRDIVGNFASSQERIMTIAKNF